LAILNPEHLLDQAGKLITPPPAGPPRQVDLRRAVSVAYYAVFHATLSAAADLYVGATKRTTNQYALVYRSVDHRELRDIASKMIAPALSSKLLPYSPSGGFDADIKAFAQAVVDLQEQRHDADYNPSVRLRTTDAVLAIDLAREALRRLRTAQATSRDAFLGLLLFRIR
jgi:uncharacterized protein (UPF0332 family)